MTESQAARLIKLIELYVATHYWRHVYMGDRIKARMTTLYTELWPDA